MGLTILMTAYHRPTDLTRSVASFLLHTPELSQLHILDNSNGAIDRHLDTINDTRVTVHRGGINVGKPEIIKRYYTDIMSGQETDHFVGSDGDIEVTPGWYPDLLAAVHKVRPWAAIAPRILDPGDRQDGPTRMHTHQPDTREVEPGIYYNRSTAGSLLLIRRRFWENWGGYPGGRLYGNDDGALCTEATRRGLFIGYTNHVTVTHLNADSCQGYVDWKKRNVYGDVDGVGYFDARPRPSHPG